ncbi:hypothetical protein [Marinicella sp. W31]|uniref:hypothetical protein n=1 Tax=Marinicella sp. W31 TaxID=3023713 RepID=UPI003757BB7D
MKKTKIFLCVFLACISLGYAHAQYEIKKHTINNGGGTLTGGSYELNSSVGQVDANMSQSNGQYTINGGFWQENNDLIFKNSFE